METETNKHDEFVMLCHNQFDRLETYNEYKDFINNLDNGKKQKRYRKMLQEILIHISYAKIGNNGFTKDYTLQDLLDGKVKPMFNTADDEYSVINKFGRGIWDEHSIRTGFNKVEEEIIVEIAKGFGAFNY
jgi:hypothetical protein